MSEVEWAKNLLEHGWEESISNRDNDVPEPTFVLEKDQSQTNLRARDTGYVASAGDTEETPLGFGWTHENIDTIVAIEYRAAKRNVTGGYNNPYNRIHGKPTGENGLQAPDRWDGIAGETRRVLLDNRKGKGQWDVVADTLRVVDNIDTGGKHYYRADVIFGLRNIASSIDTSV